MFQMIRVRLDSQNGRKKAGQKASSILFLHKSAEPLPDLGKRPKKLFRSISRAETDAKLVVKDRVQRQSCLTLDLILFERVSFSTDLGSRGTSMTMGSFPPGLS